MSYASVAAKEVVQIIACDLIVQILDEEYAVGAGRKLGLQKGQISIIKRIEEGMPYGQLVFALTSRMTFEAFEDSDRRVEGALVE